MSIVLSDGRKANVSLRTIGALKYMWIAYVIGIGGKMKMIAESG